MGPAIKLLIYRTGLRYVCERWGGVEIMCSQKIIQHSDYVYIFLCTFITIHKTLLDNKKRDEGERSEVEEVPLC